MNIIENNYPVLANFLMTNTYDYSLEDGRDIIKSDVAFHIQHKNVNAIKRFLKMQGEIVSLLRSESIEEVEEIKENFIGGRLSNEEALDYLKWLSYFLNERMQLDMKG